MKTKPFKPSPKIGLPGLALVVVLCSASQSTKAAQEFVFTPFDPPDVDCSVHCGKRLHQQFVFTPFDPPGSVLTFPFGINNNGLIAGQYNDAAGTSHSFTLKHGHYTVIDVPSAANTLSTGPNMQGQIALAYANPPDYYCHAAVYWRGHYIYLPDAPGELNVSPSAINARGQISGVVWSDNFTIVHAYVWDGWTYHIYDHPATDISFTLGFGINNQGQIVGQYNTSDGVIHGYLKNGDNYTEIAFPGAPNTVPFGINNSGVIVGLYGKAGPGPFGFAVGSSGFVLSRGVYSPFNYPGAVTSFPLGNNDTGEIVGVYQDAEGAFHGYLATPIGRK